MGHLRAISMGICTRRKSFFRILSTFLLLCYPLVLMRHPLLPHMILFETFADFSQAWTAVFGLFFAHQ